MNLNEYQKLAQRTDATKDDAEKQLNAKLGLIGESGEVVDELKKWKFQSGSMAMPEEKLLEELGDVLWYCAALLTANHAEMETVLSISRENGTVLQSDMEIFIPHAVLLASACCDIFGLKQASSKVAYAGIIIQIIDSLCEALGYSLSDCCERNIEKLKKRYPDGFDPERSLHREA